MINENKSVRDLKRMVLIGAIVALVSQLYWNLFVYNFRISSSVIVLPVLLMTLGKNLSTTMTCSVTAVIVFLFRLIAAVNGGADLITSAENLFPNAVFYFCYGIIFNAMIPGNIPCPSAGYFRRSFLQILDRIWWNSVSQRAHSTL